MNSYDLVFWAPPWRDIYVNGPERPQDWEYAEKLGISLRMVYVSLGYDVINLPHATVAERAAFITAHL